MVIVLAVDILDVQCQAGRLGEGLEPFLEQFGVHLPELRAREGDLPDQVGAVRGVEADLRQRLVERDDGVPIALDPGALAQCLRHRLADDIAGVLGGMVKIDVQIALGVQRDVDEAVLGQLLEHVVEKTDPGRDLRGTAAVEIDPALDPRLFRVALDRRDPHRNSPKWQPPAAPYGALLTRSARGCQYTPETLNAAFTLPGSIERLTSQNRSVSP